MYRTSEDYERITQVIIDIYIDYNITELPISAYSLCRKLGVALIPYSSFEKKRDIKLLKRKSLYAFFVNVITVGEYFIDRGYYVAFLQEKQDQKRADLSIGGVHTEVKGMSSTSTNKVCNNIKEAFEQVSADNLRYPEETHRDGQVIILSKYPSARIAYTAVYGGYRKAVGKGYVHGNVFLMYNGQLYFIGGK